MDKNTREVDKVVAAPHAPTLLCVADVHVRGTGARHATDTAYALIERLESLIHAHHLDDDITEKCSITQQSWRKWEVVLSFESQQDESTITVVVDELHEELMRLAKRYPFLLNSEIRLWEEGPDNVRQIRESIVSVI